MTVTMAVATGTPAQQVWLDSIGRMLIMLSMEDPSPECVVTTVTGAMTMVPWVLSQAQDALL